MALILLLGGILVPLVTWNLVENLLRGSVASGGVQQPFSPTSGINSAKPANLVSADLENLGASAERARGLLDAMAARSRPGQLDARQREGLRALGYTD